MHTTHTHHKKHCYTCISPPNIEFTVTFTTLANHIINCHHCCYVFCCVFGSCYCIRSAVVQKSEAHTCCVGMSGIWAFTQHIWASPQKFCTTVLQTWWCDWNMHQNNVQFIPGMAQLCYLPMQPTHGYRKSCLRTKFTLHPKMISTLHMVNTTWSWIYGHTHMH